VIFHSYVCLPEGNLFSPSFWIPESFDAMQGTFKLTCHDCSPKLLRLSVKQMNKHFVWIQYCQSHHCALTTFGHSTAYPSQPFFVPSPLASSCIAGKDHGRKQIARNFGSSAITQSLPKVPSRNTNKHRALK
jgi:hypothetical protein